MIGIRGYATGKESKLSVLAVVDTWHDTLSLYTKIKGGTIQRKGNFSDAGRK